jgi:hypothetical protein
MNTNTQRKDHSFNDSIFNLRKLYHRVFPKVYQEDNERKLKESLGESNKKGLISRLRRDKKKEYKIQYKVNLLTSVSEEDGTPLITAIAESQDYEIFTSSVVQEVI